MNKELARLLIDLLIWLDLQLNLKCGAYDKESLEDILTVLHNIYKKHPKFENNVERKEIIQDVLDNIYQEAKLYEEQ